ncbi:MAG: hypothetical protein KF878_03325 [Planctomycetes bacterium]|nr:hypothetical protein [Planctomycetota bacterium]
MEEHLRRLERAAAAPYDAVEARAFARACERAGDPARAWPVRCRLARGGDLDSWDALEARPAGVRRQPEVMDFASLAPGMAPAVGAHGDLLFLLRRRSLQALRPDGLEVVWSLEGDFEQASAALCGPWVALLRPDRPAQLALIERATGVEALAAPLPGWARDARLEVRADRVVVWYPVDAQVVVDVGERPGEVAELPRVVRRDYVGLAGDTLLNMHADDLMIRARSLDTGEVRWELEARLVASDPRGGALVAPLGSRDLLAVDTRTGAPWWECSRMPGTWLLDGPTWVQVVEGDGAVRSIREVRALARADGRELWRARGRLVGQRLLAWARAADVLYLALEGERRTIFGVDLETGEELFCSHGLLPEPRFVLVPTEGSLVVITDLGRSRIERLA